MSVEGHNYTLASLIEAARDSKQERDKLLSILQLEPTRRKAAVNVLVMQMRKDQAPPTFVEAWDSLQSDAVADQALQLLRNTPHSKQEQLLARWILPVVFGFGLLLVILLSFFGKK